MQLFRACSPNGGRNNAVIGRGVYTVRGGVVRELLCKTRSLTGLRQAYFTDGIGTLRHASIYAAEGAAKRHLPVNINCRAAATVRFCTRETAALPVRTPAGAPAVVITRPQATCGRRGRHRDPSSRLIAQGRRSSLADRVANVW